MGYSCAASSSCSIIQFLLIMLSDTPISFTPSKMRRVAATSLTTSSRIFVYDSKKPDGDPKLSGTIGIEDFKASKTAVTATAAGAQIPATADFVTVTSASADNIVILPDPVVGKKLEIYVAATGYELRTSAPAAIAINGGSGAGAESAIGANVLVKITCTTLTTWVGSQLTAAGVLSAIQVAAA